MCRFRDNQNFRSDRLSQISIHQMCRFRHTAINNLTCSKAISIHQMCRFRLNLITRSVNWALFQYIKCAGSAWKLGIEIKRELIFQYIKCAGSAEKLHHIMKLTCNFNTSNVPVPPNLVMVLPQYEAISIHQMCRFRF